MAGDEAGKNQNERHRERHQPADGCGRKHPFAQHRTARGTEIKPIKSGLNQNKRERDEEQMPEQHSPLKTTEDVFRERGEERLHAAKLKNSADG